MKIRISERKKEGLFVTTPETLTAGTTVFDIFIPAAVEPARIYVTSVQQHLADVVYNARAVNDTLFAAIEKELGRTGETIPVAKEARWALAQRLTIGAAGDACSLRLPERLPPGVSLPEKIYAPQAIFPAREAQSGKSGVVVIEGILLEDGFFWPQRVLVDPGLPGFVDSAVAAVTRWRFRPSELHGCAVAKPITISITYTQGQ